MKLKLIQLPEQWVIVSDEPQKKGDSIVHKTTFDLTGVPDEIGSTQEWWYKVIAGLPKQPQIDYSMLNEEDCNTIGWYNLDKMSLQNYPIEMFEFESKVETMDLNARFRQVWAEGFEAALSLSNRRYSEEEVIAFGKKCFYKGFESCNYDDGNCFTSWREKCHRLLSALKQPEVFDIEVEMEEATASALISGYVRQPKITNNSILITKVL